MTAEFLPRIVLPLKPFFGSTGVAPAESSAASAAIRPAGTPAISTTESSSPGTTLYILSPCGPYIIGVRLLTSVV